MFNSPSCKVLALPFTSALRPLLLVFRHIQLRRSLLVFVKTIAANYEFGDCIPRTPLKNALASLLLSHLRRNSQHRAHLIRTQHHNRFMNQETYQNRIRRMIRQLNHILMMLPLMLMTHLKQRVHQTLPKLELSIKVNMDDYCKHARTAIFASLVGVAFQIALDL